MTKFFNIMRITDEKGNLAAEVKRELDGNNMPVGNTTYALKQGDTICTLDKDSPLAKLVTSLQRDGGTPDARPGDKLKVEYLRVKDGVGFFALQESVEVLRTVNNVPGTLGSLTPLVNGAGASCSTKTR